MKTPLAAAYATLLVSCTKATQPPERPPSAEEKNAIEELIAANTELDGVLFRDVVAGGTGQKILPVAKDDPLIPFLAAVFDQTLTEFNGADSLTGGLRRINEASRFFEESIRERIAAYPDYECEFPLNAEGKRQRSGYPDLRIVHKPSGSIYYLDPKLFETGSATSSLRTFYFEPKTATNKVLDDARHLLVGIEHDGNDGKWKFLHWHLVDLYDFRVRLKAEFQASNKDLYQEALILDSR